MTSTSALEEMGVRFYDTDSEAEDEEMVANLEPWVVPYEYVQRRARRRNQRKTAKEIFESPEKRRRLQRLAKAAIGKKKMLCTLACVSRYAKASVDNGLDTVSCVGLDQPEEVMTTIATFLQ